MGKPLSKQQLMDVGFYTRLFQSYPFEIHITTRIPSTVATADAHELFVEQILKPLSEHLKQKLGALSVVVPQHNTPDGPEQAHIHTLALTYSGNLADQIDDIQLFIYDLQGTLITGPDSCQVKATHSNSAKYLAENLISTEFATLNFFKKRLLAKRIKK